MAIKQFAVVDGANVAYLERSDEGKPRVSNLTAVREALLDKGYQSIIIVDASLKYEVDEPQKLESLIEEQIVRQTPAGTDADYFILKTAAELDALVISNDEYEQYRDQYPRIKHFLLHFHLYDKVLLHHTLPRNQLKIKIKKLLER